MQPFPHPGDATHKIWSRLADWLQRYLGNCSKENLDPIIKFQKEAACLILDNDINAPSHELFQQLGWFRFDEWVEYRKAVL